MYDVKGYSKERSGRGFDEILPCRMILVDLGIVVGLAVKIASDLNVDNRVMITIGAAAKEDQPVGY